MKKLLALMVAIMVVPIWLSTSVSANDAGTDIGITMATEDFAPLLWLCDSRVVYDDDMEGGRDTYSGDEMVERVGNYAFEGEQMTWKVLAMDKNGVEKSGDVYVTLGTVQDTGNPREVNCQKDIGTNTVLDSCNARIGEEEITDFNADTMVYWDCTFTVEPDSGNMYGEYWVTVEICDLTPTTPLCTILDENEYWFFNPVIALTVTGDIDFGTVRPGTISYSDTVLVGNDASSDSEVLLDMFISGTDFYDTSVVGAMCPLTNRLKLGDNLAEAGGTETTNQATANTAHLDDKCEIKMKAVGGVTTAQVDAADHLCYFATNGAYDTQDDIRKDAEGYSPIVYGNSFTTDFYNDAEIIGTTSLISLGGINYFAGNVLAPNSEIAVTFKLGLPEPCNGDFDSGSIYFWGEAI